MWARFVVSATTVLRVLESLDLLPTFLRVVDEDEVVVVVDVEVVLWQKTRWWRKFENGASGRSLSGTSRVWPMSRAGRCIQSQSSLADSTNMFNVYYEYARHRSQMPQKYML